MAFWNRWITWYTTSDSMPAHWLRAARDALFGEMPILAGGTALFAMLAIVPTLAAMVAIYSVVADPSDINVHLAGLETVLPPNVASFIAEQLTAQARRSSGDLGLALAISVAAAVFSARSAARALIDSLNRAYRVRERRTAIHKHAITIAIASCTLIGLTLMLSVVVALPALFAIAGYENWGVISWLRWPSLMSVLYGALLLLYRFAPSPRPLADARRHLWEGALITTVLLVSMSWALTLWVDRVANYNLWYGTFGTVVIVMLWCYLSTIAIVLGGFVNAELERHSGAPAPDRSMY